MFMLDAGGVMCLSLVPHARIALLIVGQPTKRRARGPLDGRILGTGNQHWSSYRQLSWWLMWRCQALVLCSCNGPISMPGCAVRSCSMPVSFLLVKFGGLPGVEHGRRVSWHSKSHGFVVLSDVSGMCSSRSRHAGHVLRSCGSADSEGPNLEFEQKHRLMYTRHARLEDHALAP